LMFCAALSSTPASTTAGPCAMYSRSAREVSGSCSSSITTNRPAPPRSWTRFAVWWKKSSTGPTSAGLVAASLASSSPTVADPFPTPRLTSTPRSLTVARDARIGSKDVGALERSGDAVDDVGQEPLVLDPRDPGHHEAISGGPLLHIGQKRGLTEPSRARNHAQRAHHLAVRDHSCKPVAQQRALLLPAHEHARRFARGVRTRLHLAPQLRFV